MRAKPLPQLSEREIARFWSDVEKSDGCWNWKGPWSSSKKYGRSYGLFAVTINGSRRRLLPHRVSKALLTGDHPELDVDHLCENRFCVNPDHLEWVSHSVNKTRQRKRRTHCKRGHPVSERNRFGQCVPCVKLKARERAAA